MKNKLALFAMMFSLLITLTALFIVAQNKQLNFGSVSQGSEYIATSTRNHLGVAMANNQLLQTGNGVLGSIVITGANTGVINIYDATTTGAHSDYPTYLLASIPASAAAGEYPIDSRFIRGLVVEVIGTAPTSTITFR